MSHSPLFDNLARLIRIAHHCERHGITTAEGLALNEEARARNRFVNRRQFIGDMGKWVAAGALIPASRIGGLFKSGNPSIGIVGAGLAGLACADTLRNKGINSTVYDANTRTGGRCFSLRNFFPGQVAERGGEFIDTPHKTMLGYAQRFDLVKEDVVKQPGEVFYYFNGQHFPESSVVDEYREFVAAMHVDLRSLSNAVTADNHTPADARIDNINLLEYLEGNNGAGLVAAPVIKNAIIETYEAEYGLAADEQSCLNFLQFIHADKRSKFTPFGIFSDERWHVVGGNDKIVENLSGVLVAQIQLEMRLVRIRLTSSGRIELTFRRGATTLTRLHDAVVVSIPFTVLREVELDSSLKLPPEKTTAINLLGYGTNAKMMIGFSSRPWVAQGSNGASYSDLPHHQTTWETNPTRATASNAVLTDYSSGERGANLNPARVQSEASNFLTDLDLVYPGAFAAATRSNGRFVVHLEHWPSNPLTKGSYTCYTPGQFTTIAGNEGKPVGNLHFAGEHTNSFYEFQGFMEGAALSGIQAAQEILQDIKVGNL